MNVSCFAFQMIVLIIFFRKKDTVWYTFPLFLRYLQDEVDATAASKNLDDDTGV